jgi:type I restriction enzyme, R subunit
MSAHAYTEDQLVEQPAIGLFAELGWSVAGPPPNAGVAGEPRDAGLLGRETKGEVVLVGRLRAALEKLNPTLPPEAIAAAIDELTRDRSAMLLEQANCEVYRLLKEGIPVSVADTGVSTPRPLLPGVTGISLAFTRQVRILVPNDEVFVGNARCD